MLSIEQCKKILNRNENRYSDEQVKIIRDWLTNIASIEVKLFQMKGAANECGNIHASVNARSEGKGL